MTDKADKAKAAAEKAAAEQAAEILAEPGDLPLGQVPDPTVPGAALVAPAELPEGGAGSTEPAVVSERGSVVLRLADWTLAAFEMVLPAGEEDGAKPCPISVTRDGLRVTKAQAEEIKACARAHGVELTEETA